MYAIVKIGTMLSLLLACILLTVWVFRPNSKSIYTRHSKIALKDDKAVVANERRGSRG